MKAIAIAFVGSVIGLLIAFLFTAQQHPELHKQLIAASLALLFGACFGGIVKMLLDEAVAEKRRRDDAAAFVANVLADLKKVYDHVERARLLIPAHQSAKTYGDAMREDVTAGVVQLRNVIRALQGRVAGVPVGLQQLVRPEVEEMKRYLLELMDEFCLRRIQASSRSAAVPRIEGREACEGVCRGQRRHAARADARLRLVCCEAVAEAGRVHARWAGV